MPCFTTKLIGKHLRSSPQPLLLFPSWTRFLNTVAARAQQYGFKTLLVPPGTHRVELVFRPLVGERAMLFLDVFITLSLVAQRWLAYAGQRVLPERPV